MSRIYRVVPTPSAAIIIGAQYKGVTVSIFGEVKAIGLLLRWAETATDNYPWQLLKFPNGTPFLQIRVSDPFGLIVIPRNKQRILIFDDADPGSIPTEQLIGGYTDDPPAVVERINATIEWFAKKCLDARDLDRAVAYARILDRCAKATKNNDLRLSAGDLIVEVGREQIDNGQPRRAIQTLLYARQQVYDQIDNSRRASMTRYWQGRAAEDLIKLGESDVDPALYYELCIEKFPKKAESELLDDARERLSILRLASKEEPVEPVSQQLGDGDIGALAGPISGIRETADSLAGILSQLPWLSVSYLPLGSSADGIGIQISSPYSGESVALINDGQWALWRPRPDNQPRFIHDLQLASDVPPAFLSGQIANIEAQDMFDILEQGGDYIRSNFPNFGSDFQLLAPFWNWLPGTLDAADQLHRPLLDEMTSAYMQQFIDRVSAL